MTDKDTLEDTTIYQQMLDQSRIHNAPEAFIDDLVVHDKNRLDALGAPPRFGWVLRLSGTELLDTRMGTESMADYIAHYSSGLSDTATYHFFVCERGMLSEARTFEDWCRTMRRWNAIDSEGPMGNPYLNRY